VPIPYIVRGKIGKSAGNPARVGRFTYIAQTGVRFYIWDGAHKATPFDLVAEGPCCGQACYGPRFNAPDPDTINAAEASLQPVTIW
jgi:hypothetical protein